jgi:Flp pilus assembly pilin Flp
MMNLIRNFVREENGEDLIEYGLLAAFVAAVALVTIILDPIGIKGALVGAFDKARVALETN